jgi:hypothetical protein
MSEDKTIKEKLHEELLLLKDKYGFEFAMLWTRQDIVKCGDKVAMLANSINATIYLFSEVILETEIFSIDDLPGLMKAMSQDIKERVQYLKKQEEK